MNNKTLYAIIVVLVVVIVGGGIYFSRGSAPATGTPPAPNQNQTPAVPVSTLLSEQPNQAKYDEYLSDIYLGKMAIGKKIGTDGLPVRTTVFTSGTDLFCTMMQLKKTIAAGHITGAVYDTVAKQYVSPKSVFPMALKAGGSSGCSDLTQPPGKYEDKLYIDDVLAAVLPFDVK